MNDYNYQKRIEQLQKKRHELLDSRQKTEVSVACIDMELNVVRTELQSIYAMRRNYATQNYQVVKA